MISPETLRFFPFFAGQNHYMLKEIALLSEEKTIEADEWLFRQGDPAFRLYVILEGGVSLALILNRNGNGEQIEKLGTLGRGEILGWSSMVHPYIYSLGAQATSKTKLAEIDAGGLRELLEDNPKYGYYLMKNLTEIIGERLDYKCIQLLSMVVEPNRKKSSEVDQRTEK